MDFAARFVIFPFKLIGAVLVAFSREIIIFLVISIIKITLGFTKHFVWSCIKLTVKGNLIERIIFILLLAIEYILYSNFWIVAQSIPVLTIMIMGGLKK